MAKKPKQSLYKMTFVGRPEEYIFKVNSIGRGEGFNSLFLRADHSPGVLLHTELEYFKALEETGLLTMDVIREEGRHWLQVKDGTDRVMRNIDLHDYSAIRSSADRKLFELEQRGPDNTWVMCHTTGFLPGDKLGTDQIIFQKVE